MTIAPVRVSVEISQPPAEAFDLFALRISDWWQGKAVGAAPPASITIEPQAGGRWYETDADGNQTPWGKVLAWEPPGRLLLAWELNSQFRPDPAIQTEIELVFAALPLGGTRVSLEHRNLERYGADAERIAGQIGEGWPRQLEGFALRAETIKESTAP